MSMNLPKKLDAIFHIGAGECEELPAYLASSARKIVLVEPNPSLASRLRRNTQSDARVEVLEFAVSDNPELTQLSEYNLLEAGSLYQPQGLRHLFPGLRLLAQHSVRTRSPEALLEQQPLEGTDNLLVLQAPGVELAMIKALVDAQKIDRIAQIWLTGPTETYYENAPPARETLNELKRQGYEIQNKIDSDPDWPQWQLASNPLARKAQALKVNNRALTAALEVADAKRSDAESYAEALVLKIKRLEDEYKAGLSSHKQFGELKEKIEHIVGRQNSVLEVAAKASKGSSDAALGEQFNIHMEECERLKAELQDRDDRLEAQDREVGELKSKNRQLVVEYREVRARQKTLEEEIRKAEAQIEMIQQLWLNNDA